MAIDPALATGIGVGGTILGVILKGTWDTRVEQRRDWSKYYLQRYDTLVTLSAKLVELNQVVSDTRHAYWNVPKGQDKRTYVTVVRAKDSFLDLYREALVISERYGLVPSSSGLDQRRLSNYVSSIYGGLVKHNIDSSEANWQQYDAWEHTFAILHTVRQLAEYELQMSRSSLRTMRKKSPPINLDYLNSFRPYFANVPFDASKISDWYWEENQMVEEHFEEEERQRKIAISRSSEAEPAPVQQSAP